MSWRYAATDSSALQSALTPLSSGAVANLGLVVIGFKLSLLHWSNHASLLCVCVCVCVCGLKFVVDYQMNGDVSFNYRDLQNSFRELTVAIFLGFSFFSGFVSSCEGIRLNVIQVSFLFLLRLTLLISIDYSMGLDLFDLIWLLVNLLRSNWKRTSRHTRRRWQGRSCSIRPGLQVANVRVPIGVWRRVER